MAKLVSGGKGLRTLCGYWTLKRRKRRAPLAILSSPYMALLSVLFVVWLCTGCVPMRFTTSPGASGKIVDASSHSPLSGAEIVISRSTYPPDSADKAFANRRPPIVMSREGGLFSVPLERRLDLYFVPLDAFPRFGLLVVKCQGYETTCVPFWSRSVADLGEIGLKANR
jgi:hypothetical protein